MARGKDELLQKAIDKMDSMDSMAVVIMAAAGTAGLCGVKGPLSTIVSGLSGTGLTATNGSPGILDYVSPGVFIYDLLSGNIKTNTSDLKTDTEKAAYTNAIGTAAANVVEAGLLYTFVKNDEVLRAGIDALKTAIGNATKTPIIPV